MRFVFAAAILSVVFVMVVACTDAVLHTNTFGSGCNNGNCYNNGGSMYGSGFDGDPGAPTGLSAATGPTFQYPNSANTMRNLITNLRVIGAAGNTWTMSRTFSTLELIPGDELLWAVIAANNTNCSGHQGQYGFVHVSSTNVALNQITVDNGFPDSNIQPDNGTYTSGGTFCMVEVTRVPNFTNLTIQNTGSINALSFGSGTAELGGIIAFRVQGTLTIDGTISAYASGFSNSPSLAGDSDIGPGTPGGSSNRSGGGGTFSVQGGAGGGNYGNGGGYSPAIGQAYTDCGGATCNPDTHLRFGGAGGGDVSGVGGFGGGIIYIAAKKIAGAGIFTAAGGNGGSGTNGAGGGAGGDVLLLFYDGSSFSGNVNANGGNPGTGGGSAGAGGGGAVEAVHCFAMLSGTLNAFIGSPNNGISAGNGATLTPYDSNACQ